MLLRNTTQEAKKGRVSENKNWMRAKFSGVIGVMYTELLTQYKLHFCLPSLVLVEDKSSLPKTMVKCMETTTSHSILLLTLQSFGHWQHDETSKNLFTLSLSLKWLLLSVTKALNTLKPYYCCLQALHSRHIFNSFQVKHRSKTFHTQSLLQHAILHLASWGNFYIM